MLWSGVVREAASGQDGGVGRVNLTTALLDRLRHHAHVLTTSGSSYRTRKRKDKSEEEQPMEA